MKKYIHNIYGFFFKFWRPRRMRMFLNLIKPTTSDSLLDVGGYPKFWTAYPPYVGQIDCLNVHLVKWKTETSPQHQIRTLVGNGCAMAFADKSYTIAFSNSVIEHVGNWEEQQAFASEIRRVGQALWVQTPAKECPIEPHYMTLFLHWFPKNIQILLVRWVTLWGLLQKPSKEQAKQVVSNIQLLTRHEMELLFPDCQILTERLFGVIPKSYIAVRGKSVGTEAEL